MHAVVRRREFGFQPAALFQLFDDLLDVLAVADRRDEGRVRRSTTMATSLRPIADSSRPSLRR